MTKWLNLNGFIQLNKNTVFLIIGILLILGIIPLIGAQTFDVREISIKKNRPDEIYYKAATKVSIWVSDDIGSFESLLIDESHIDVFKDDKGFDLIDAHYKAIKAWDEKVANLAKNNTYVSMGRSRELLSAEGLDDNEGATGFYLTVESWTLPAKDSRSLHLAGNVSYLVALHKKNSKIFSEMVFGDTESFQIDDYKVSLSDYSEDDDMCEFAFNSELPIDDAAIYNSDGEKIGGITWRMDGVPYLEIPKDYWNKPVKLEVIYRNLRKLSPSFDETVGLGF